MKIPKNDQPLFFVLLFLGVISIPNAFSHLYNNTPHAQDTGFLGVSSDGWVAIFTFVLAIFTLGLWISSIWQGILTRQSIDLARDEFTTAQRAFVYLDGFDTEITPLSDQDRSSIPEELFYVDPELYITRFAILPRWKNSGDTPTVGLRIQIDWRAPDTSKEIGTYTQQAIPFFLPPQATTIGEVIDIQSLNALIQDGSPLTEAPPLLIWGRADYGDIFGGKHWIKWCYRIRPERHRKDQPLRVHFIQYSEHNESGESI